MADDRRPLSWTCCDRCDRREDVRAVDLPGYGYLCVRCRVELYEALR